MISHLYVILQEKGHYSSCHF